MKILYPKGLDFSSMSPSREERNSVDTRAGITFDDMMYVVRELEVKVGIDGSEDAGSLDYRVSQLEGGNSLSSLIYFETSTPQTFLTVGQTGSRSTGVAGIFANNVALAQRAGDPQWYTGAFTQGTGKDYTIGAGTAFCGAGGWQTGVLSDVQPGTLWTVLGITTGHTTEYPDIAYFPYYRRTFINARLSGGGLSTPPDTGVFSVYDGSATGGAGIQLMSISTGGTLTVYQTVKAGLSYTFNVPNGSVGDSTNYVGSIYMGSGNTGYGIMAGDNADVAPYTLLYFDTLSGQNNIVIPAASGTVAVSASGNIALNATTGNITFTGTLGVGSGGTGQTSYTNGQLLIGNTTGNTLTKATLTGTSNQVTVTNGAGSITLSLPQDIHTSASPTFSNLTLGGGTITLSVDTNFVLSGGVNGCSFDSGVLSIDATNNAIGINTTAPGTTSILSINSGSASKDCFVDIYQPASNKSAIISFRADGTASASNPDWSMGIVYNTNDFSFSTWDGSNTYTWLQVIANVGSVVIGKAALATNATGGFLYIPSCAGTPTGVPTAYTGRVAMVYDTTNNKFYVYNGAWKAVTLA